ncbi:unnamed protein product [Closterium sp. Naga37s-1]|nr:unnamed protein product [Closterium sp. Naga37s-1]
MTQAATPPAGPTRTVGSVSADRGSESRRRRGENEDPLLESLREKRKVVVLTLDGSLSTSANHVQSDRANSKSESETAALTSSMAPWNLGILPQTCVLASRSMSMFSRGDVATNGSNGTKEDPESLRDSLLLTACDNAPLEALEIGSQARDPGDVYDVLPLLAMPLRLLGSGRNSMPISWRIVTIATDDKLVANGQLKHFKLRKLLDRVEDWAKTSDFFGEIEGPALSCQCVLGPSSRPSLPPPSLPPPSLPPPSLPPPSLPPSSLPPSSPPFLSSPHSYTPFSVLSLSFLEAYPGS